MPGPTPSIPISALWGIIRGQAFARASTAQVFRAARSALATQGLPWRSEYFFGINRLRSLAVRQRRAAERLAKAAESDAITAEMIAPSIAARSAAEQAAAPMWHVRFRHDVIAGGKRVTLWRTAIYQESLPATRAALFEDLDIVGSELAESYNTQHVSVSDVSIEAV